MRRSRLFVGLFAVLSGVALSASAEDGKKQTNSKELKSLQGTWLIQAMEIRGERRTRDDLPARYREMNRIVKGEKMTVMARGGVVCDMKIDATVKPKTIDLTIKRPGREPIILKGIYELKKDSLQIAENSRQRPKSFKTKDAIGTTVFIFQRKTTEPKPR